MTKETLRGAIEEFGRKLRDRAPTMQPGRHRVAVEQALLGCADGLDSILASHSEDGLVHPLGCCMGDGVTPVPSEDVPAKGTRLGIYGADRNLQRIITEADLPVTVEPGGWVLFEQRGIVQPPPLYLDKGMKVTHFLRTPEDVEGVQPGHDSDQGPAPSALPVELEHVHGNAWITNTGEQVERADDPCRRCLSVQELLRLLLKEHEAAGRLYEGTAQRFAWDEWQAVERKLRGSSPEEST